MAKFRPLTKNAYKRTQAHSAHYSGERLWGYANSSAHRRAAALQHPTQYDRDTEGDTIMGDAGDETQVATKAELKNMITCEASLHEFEAGHSHTVAPNPHMAGATTNGDHATTSAVSQAASPSSKNHHANVVTTSPVFPDELVIRKRVPSPAPPHDSEEPISGIDSDGQVAEATPSSTSTSLPVFVRPATAVEETAEAGSSAPEAAESREDDKNAGTAGTAKLDAAEAEHEDRRAIIPSSRLLGAYELADGETDIRLPTRKQALDHLRQLRHLIIKARVCSRVTALLKSARKLPQTTRKAIPLAFRLALAAIKQLPQLRRDALTDAKQTRADQGLIILHEHKNLPPGYTYLPELPGQLGVIRMFESYLLQPPPPPVTRKRKASEIGTPPKASLPRYHNANKWREIEGDGSDDLLDGCNQLKRLCVAYDMIGRDVAKHLHFHRLGQAYYAVRYAFEDPVTAYFRRLEALGPRPFTFGSYDGYLALRAVDDVVYIVIYPRCDVNRGWEIAAIDEHFRYLGGQAALVRDDSMDLSIQVSVIEQATSPEFVGLKKIPVLEKLYAQRLSWREMGVLHPWEGAERGKFL